MASGTPTPPLEMTPSSEANRAWSSLPCLPLFLRTDPAETRSTLLHPASKKTPTHFSLCVCSGHAALIQNHGQGSCTAGERRVEFQHHLLWIRQSNETVSKQGDDGGYRLVCKLRLDNIICGMAGFTFQVAKALMYSCLRHRLCPRESSAQYLNR